MKVVLLTDIKGVGKKGETKEVSDGYYRNFLAPKALGVLPNDPRAQKVAADLSAQVQAKQAEIAAAQAMAAQLNGKEITIQTKAQGKEVGSKLFGAVHEREVADQLKIDKKALQMDPIKTVGQHKVTVKLAHGARATITVNVIPA